ncbi:MAG: sulfate ABC transporter substrate-binding protein, partial [Devosia sp.]
WAKAQPGATDETARTYLAELFRHVPVLDTGARGATITFAQRGLGDVLLAWENEAYLALREIGPDSFEIITPSVSILAEPPVAIVDSSVDARGTRDVATAYLEYLYSDEGQALAAANYYRPFRPEAANPDDIARFGAVNLVTIEDFGGWREAQPAFFGDGGVFDQVYSQ